MFSQPWLFLHSTANAPPVWACLCSSYNNRTTQGCPVAQPWGISSEMQSCVVVNKALEELVRHLLCAVASSRGIYKSCPEPCTCPPPGKSVLKPQLEPLPFSWQAFFVLRKKAIVLIQWLSDTTASHLIWSARLVSHLLLWVEMCLVSVAITCPKCPVTVMPAPVSLTAARATA